MKTKTISRVMVWSVLFACGQVVLAYTDKTVEPVTFLNRTFVIEPTYDLQEAIAGRSLTLKVRITTESAGTDFAQVLGSPILADDDSRNLIVFASQGSRSIDNGVLSSREYLYDVRISANAEPRRYKIKLDLGYPNQEIVPRVFYLNVGVVSKGMLTLVKDDDVEAQPRSFETGVFAGQRASYGLDLRNSFPDYTVYIEKITIESDPEGMIRSQEFNFPEPLTLRPSEEKTVPLSIEIAPLTIRNLLKGLGAAPRIKAEVVYNDGNERRISDWKSREKVNISPTDRVVLGAVLLGLLFGAIIRAILEFMLFKKQITRRGVVKVVSYSLVFGMLVVLLAVAGKIEIKAFAVSGSYDNPVAMLIIGLMGAVAGLQLIIGWYKSLKAD